MWTRAELLFKAQPENSQSAGVGFGPDGLVPRHIGPFNRVHGTSEIPSHSDYQSPPPPNWGP